VPTHWTYREFSPGDDLCQGDIIARNEPVLAVLRQVHSYFCDEKYLCFIVLTQSCDLVIRKGETCKAKQISLAVVRALDDLLPEIFHQHCGTEIPGLYRVDNKVAATDFLERVINQNEQAQGLFYLHPDADVGIAVPAVALLRVSISLRSNQHYKMLREARRGKLDTEFRNKLGWLTGNLYSRVDTTDWADQDGGAEQSQKLITRLIDAAGTAEENIWVPEAWVKAAKAKRVDLKKVERNVLYSTLASHAPPPADQAALDRVKARAVQALNELNDKQLERLLSLVKDDVAYALLASHQFLLLARELGIEAQAIPLLTKLPDAPAFRHSITGQVSLAIEEFKQRKGAREIAAFFTILKGTPFFGPDAAVVAGLLIDETQSETFAGRKEALLLRMRDEVFPQPALAHLGGIVQQVINEQFVEKLIGRLENDQIFRAAFKRV
jgi:hypothetical protein